MLERVFDSADVPVAHRVDAWREATAVALAPHEFTVDDPAGFRASLRAADLDGTDVTALTCGPVRARRTPRSIRRSDPEKYAVGLVLRGRQVIVQDGCETALGAGDLVVCSTSHPYTAAAEGGRRRAACAVVQVPRARIPLPADRVHRITATRLPGGDAVGGLLAGFLARLAADAGPCRPADGRRLGGVLADLVTAWLAHHADAEERTPEETCGSWRCRPSSGATSATPGSRRPPSRPPTTSRCGACTASSTSREAAPRPPPTSAASASPAPAATWATHSWPGVRSAPSRPAGASPARPTSPGPSAPPTAAPPASTAGRPCARPPASGAKRMARAAIPPAPRPGHHRRARARAVRGARPASAARPSGGVRTHQGEYMKLTRLKAGVVAASVTGLLATGLALAPAASAAAFRCGDFGSDPLAWCAYVQKAPSGLKVHSGPSTGSSVIGTLANGAKVEVDCWTTGTSVNGYNIWAGLYSAGGYRYVSDYYLTTGHIQSYVVHC
jgi:AraC-binding-like domain/Bacterial SH3 domain